MIEITLMDGHKVIVNADLIEMIETKPDTILRLTTGKKLMVKDKPADIINKVIHYKRSIFRDIRISND